jgi:regulator of protease activity HflC (stomatin/prohibitin superfamily)
MVIARHGRYQKTLNAGLHFIFPFLDMPRAIALRETVYDFPRRSVTTKDDIPIIIDLLLYFQIVDAKSAVYEIANLPEAVKKLTRITLENFIGQLELQETLVSRDKINNELKTILNDAANKWGVKVNRVELINIDKAESTLKERF